MARKLEVTTRITHAGAGIDYPLVSAVGNVMAQNDVFLSVVAKMISPSKYHIMEYLFSGAEGEVIVSDWVTTFNRIFKYAVTEKNQQAIGEITYISGTVAEGATIVVSVAAASPGTFFDVGDTWQSPDANVSLNFVERVVSGGTGDTFRAIVSYTTASAARLATNIAVGSYLVYLNHTVGEHSEKGKGMSANGGFSQRFNAVQTFRRSASQTGRAVAALGEMGKNPNNLRFIQIQGTLSSNKKQGFGITIPDYIGANGKSLVQAIIEDMFNTMMFGLPNFNVENGTNDRVAVTHLNSPDILHMAGVRYQIKNFSTPFTYSVAECNRNPETLVDKLIQHVEQARIDCDAEKVDLLIIAGRGSGRIIRDGFQAKNPTIMLNVKQGEKVDSVVDLTSIMMMNMHNGSIKLAETEFTSRVNNTVAGAQNTYAYKGNVYSESEFEVMIIPRFTFVDASTGKQTPNIVPVTSAPNRRLYLGVVSGMTGAFKGMLSQVSYTGNFTPKGKPALTGKVGVMDGFTMSGFEVVGTGSDADYFHALGEASVMMKSTDGAYLGLPKA